MMEADGLHARALECMTEAAQYGACLRDKSSLDKHAHSRAFEADLSGTIQTGGGMEPRKAGAGWMVQRSLILDILIMV